MTKGKESLKYQCPECKSEKALAQPVQTEQEPVVFYRCKGCSHAYEDVAPSSCDCMDDTGFERVEYFTTPPLPVQRTWVGLTVEDMTKIDQRMYPTWKDEIQAIEDNLKEKNG